MPNSTVLAAGPAAYSIEEAADQLRVSRSQIYALIRRGLMRKVKIGGRTVIPASEVARLAEEGTQEAVNVT